MQGVAKDTKMMPAARMKADQVLLYKIKSYHLFIMELGL